ncbi:hypothetical protein PDJAM_G00195920 [Pangasius djambal]|uniref:Uncharacterized protein n=1 Tax=Pangasius djambal TaxID=1691987 RepID=A0ACC5Y5Y1_9TELE|nr:hypothetical protein [Pangasius djambal]
MAPAVFNLIEARDKFTAATRNALETRTCKPLMSVFNHFPGNETEKKSTLDQSLRGVLEEQIVKHADVEDHLSLISISISGVTEGENKHVASHALERGRETQIALSSAL